MNRHISAILNGLASLIFRLTHGHGAHDSHSHLRGPRYHHAPDHHDDHRHDDTVLQSGHTHTSHHDHASTAHAEDAGEATSTFHMTPPIEEGMQSVAS